MPDLKNDKLPSRDYVINVGIFASLFLLIVNTLLPDELQEMVEKVKAKNEEIYNKLEKFEYESPPRIPKDIF